MLQPSISQLYVRKEVGDFQKQRTQRVVIYIPSRTDCPVCGFDEFTQSGQDVSCTTCEGTGKVTTWYKSHSSARVMWIDLAAPRWGAVATGDIGDAWLSVPLSYESLYNKVEDTDGAYILVDGETVKPISITPNRVEGKSSLDVRCQITK